jgi:transposase-like protein
MRKHRYGQGSRRWHVDEAIMKVNGKWTYLYRALDHEGTLLDVRLSETCDLPAARAFFRAARLITKRPPQRVTHRTTRYANNVLVDCGISFRTNFVAFLRSPGIELAPSTLAKGWAKR